MPDTPKDGATATPRKIHDLAVRILDDIGTAIRAIEGVNLSTRLLAMNTRVEAARLGEKGAAMSVIGAEMVELSARTAQSAKELGTRTRAMVDELVGISGLLSSQVRGTRLADLALTNIDLIDRNLYERSCDVRWWATDPAFVRVVAEPDDAAAAYASRRMAAILKAYTVYFDIVLLDADGRVIANGRPDRYRSAGTRHAGQPWFEQAAAAASGDAFGFQGVHASALAGGERVLVYSAKVRPEGRAGGAEGVLGIVFRWDALAGTIVKATPVDAADRDRTRALIVDAAGTVLADSRDAAGGRTFPVSVVEPLRGAAKGHLLATLDGRQALVGYARSPGFETYATGWHSFVIHEGA